MAETKPIIGLRWEPKLPEFSSGKKAKEKASSSSPNHAETSGLWKPQAELVDGLYVPPNDPRKVNNLLRKQIKDSAGSGWFDLPAPTMTPELKKDLQLLKLRNVIDPKRHYKKGGSNMKSLPKYFQVGTVIESATEFYSGRLTNKERKPTLADDLLSDPNVTHYRKRKVREIEDKNRPGGNEKWKVKGRQSFKRAKQRRH